MANAGRVAIVPKGDYSSATAYKRLDLVRYNNNAYVAKKASTGVAPTDTTYWMLTMENITQQQYNDLLNGTTSAGNAIKLGGESAEQWQEKIDNIQTTSRATLSQAGWYRVAEYKASNNAGALGANANGAFITIRRVFGSTNGEEHNIILLSRHQVQEFIPNGNFASNSNYQFITKIRYTAVDSTAYLEIYYNGSSSNPISVSLSRCVDGNGISWKAITPTLTSETVDGVTVTTTYDIPANASSVTDLDLVPLKGTEILNTSILEKAVSLPLGIYSYRLGGAGYTGGDVPKYYNYSEATIIRREKGTMCVILWGTYNVTAPIINYYDGSGWTGWDDFVTGNALATELSKYLPNEIESITGPILEYAATLPDNSVKFLNLHTGGKIPDLPDDSYGYSSALIINRFGTNSIVFLFGRQGETTPIAMNAGYLDSNGAWQWRGWDFYVTTSKLATELAKYFPNTGGEIDGSVIIGSTATEQYYLTLKNAKRTITQRLYSTGFFSFEDLTNGYNIFSSSIDGANAFNGVATGCLAKEDDTSPIIKSWRVNVLDFDSTSETRAVLTGYKKSGVIQGYLGFDGVANPVYSDGNNPKTLLHTGNIASHALPLDGGGTVKKAGETPVVLENTSGDTTQLAYVGKSGVLGYFGYQNADNPIVYSPTLGTHKLLHTGNSVPIVKSTTAPSDTSAVWIDTTNKKTKAYIDGAWTVIA